MKVDLCRLTVFNTKVDNLIEWDSTTFNYIQGKHTKIKGLNRRFVGLSDLIFLSEAIIPFDAMQGSTVAARVPKHDIQYQLQQYLTKN